MIFLRPWQNIVILSVSLLIIALAQAGDSLNAGDFFQRSSLIVVTKSGQRTFAVEIAQTPRQRTQGLQGRKTLPPGTGMLFDFEHVQPVTMWMKNTHVSLDMLFISADGTVVNIARNTEPLSLKYITSDGPVRGVLEIQAGTSRILGIAKGDRIVHAIFKTAN